MRRLLAALAVLAFPLTALAAPVPFDFSTIGGSNPHGTSLSDGGVLAEGFATNFSNPQPLWVRNDPDDHGIGVCSEGTDACSSGGGDVNELSNQENSEAIRLTRPLNTIWTSLWVSSLDSGGSNDAEAGILEWSNDPLFSSSGSFQFAFGDFGTDVEGDILTLAQASGFDPTARFLLFLPDAKNGDNNDYLVWKGETTFRQLQETPEPASLALLGIALGALALGRRKRV